MATVNRLKEPDDRLRYGQITLAQNFNKGLLKLGVPYWESLS